MLTQGQIEAPSDVATLLDTTADCLRFVTEFFEVISQSAPHIYHSALLLAPQSSVVRKLYEKYISSPVSNAATDIPTSWDSRAASAGAAIEVTRAVWSPVIGIIDSQDVRLIAVGRVDGVELRNLKTLRSEFIPGPPEGLPGMTLAPRSLAFSPDGLMLACAYHR
jgi:hypothetical protein